MHTDDEVIASMQKAIDAAMRNEIISLSEVAGVLFHAVKAAGKQYPPMIVVQYVRCATVVYERVSATATRAKGTD